MDTARAHCTTDRLHHHRSGRLGAGAQVNALSAGEWSPLTYAASYGHVAIVHDLLAARAVLNHLAREGYSPLYAASEGGLLARFRSI